MREPDLSVFFNPRSIAILGASQNLASISGRAFYYLRKHGYKGAILPVNPKYEKIEELTCYPDVKSIPGDVDLALIVVNYKLVYPMLEQCAEKGVPFVTIFSSGFAEAGEEGREIQRKIAELAKSTGMRICGPNCQGGVDLFNGTAAAFSGALDLKPLIPGPIGFVTQSGALGYSIFNLAQESQVGFSYVINTGNEVDLDCADFINYMLDDPNTRMVAAYLEGVRNGSKFIQTADKAARLEKPVVILKVGRSSVGKKAASSHTGALAGSDEVYDAVFRQRGVIRVKDIEEFIDIGKLMTCISRAPSGTGIGIVSTSGGAGILCADTAEECGLKVSELQPETREVIQGLIPHFGSSLNPVDMTAQILSNADGFPNLLQSMINDPGVNALVVVVTMVSGQLGMRMAEDIIRMSRTAGKPIVVAWTSGLKLVKEHFEVLQKAKIPVYQSPVRAIKALSALMHYGSTIGEIRDRFGSRTAPAHMPQTAAALLNANGRGALSEHQSKQLLNAFGVALNREELVHTAEEACAAANRIGYPVALKVDSPDILHKTEAKVIELNVESREKIPGIYRKLMDNARQYDPSATINGMSVQEMIPRGVEAIIGVNHDPQFGPVVMLGLGGIFVEVMKDVSFAVAPVDKEWALNGMIKQIKGYPLLSGARGREKADVDALADVLVKVSEMACALGSRLKELDINPLIVLPEGRGVRIADALVILQPP
ncbi:MAG: acetate--CoA ligase family protein [Syntrophobacteraceae bacterium]